MFFFNKTSFERESYVISEEAKIKSLKLNK